MRPYAIELDDRMLSLARGGVVLSTAPGVTPDRASMQSFAADLARRLAAHAPAAGEKVWIASSARCAAGDLGAVLDVTLAAGLEVDGFVDAASATTAALALSGDALVLEVGQHHVAVTAVERGTQSRRRRAIVSNQGGLAELNQAWLDLISTAMVKQTRFDPLHNVATEQQLSAGLPAMMRALADAASITARVNAGSERFEVGLSRDQFAAAAQPVYREILRLLHELRPAGAPIALIMPAAVAALPGLRAALQQFVGCELVALSDGFAAAATSLLDLPGAQPGQAVRLLRRLPSQEQPALAALVSREALGSIRAAGPAPSHLLFDGKAYALAGTLVVGRAAGSPQAVTLPDGLAGVSRCHCTLVSEAGELTLVDHSHFGTFLNGERVSERARLHAGDRIRVGDPGIELSLITLS